MRASSLLLPLLAAISAANALASPTVTIKNGVIVGTSLAVPGGDTVNKFLGIPFAAPPVGDLRFAPPADPKSWKKPKDVSAFSKSCWQQFNYGPGRDFGIALSNMGQDVRQSEDCLYLNVWVPTTPPKEKGGRAVMFWIYGGALESGYSGLKNYDGTTFAAFQDVIIVSINYRTNVFGYSNSPEIAFGEQNSGFLDQRKALTWVQENIAAFGGNPKRVTIFGESAGGWSVKQLLANPPSPLPYRAAILESEATMTQGGVSSWDALVAALNCTSAASPITCVRAFSAKKVENTIERLGVQFPPVSDNITSTSNVAPSIASKRWAKVPFLIGTNSQEGRAFTIGVTNITSYIEAFFPGNPTLQQKILSQYPTNESAYFTAARIITDLGFTCTTRLISNLAVKHNYDVWRYWFDASFPNNMPFPEAGVYHGSEVGLVFGTYNKTGATTQQIQLSKYMNTAWAHFAKDPESGPGWPRLGSTRNDVGDLGGNGAYGEFDVSKKGIDYACGVYTDLISSTL